MNLLQVFIKNKFLKGSHWFWKGSMVGSQPGSLSFFWPPSYCSWLSEGWAVCKNIMLERLNLCFSLLPGNVCFKRTLNLS